MTETKERFKYSKYDWDSFELNEPKELTFNNFGDMRRMQCACITRGKRLGEKWQVNKVGEFTLRIERLSKVEQNKE